MGMKYEVQRDENGELRNKSKGNRQKKLKSLGLRASLKKKKIQLAPETVWPTEQISRWSRTAPTPPPDPPLQKGGPG